MEDVSKITIWRSYFEKVWDMPDKDRLQYYDAVFRFVFCGEEPQFTGRNRGFLDVIWSTARPNLETSLKKQEAGRKGGKAEAKQTASKSEANAKQDASKTQAKAKQTASDARLRDKGEGNRDKGEREGASHPRENPAPAPTLAEVEEEARAQGLAHVDPAKFFHHYAATGWQVNGQPIQSWTDLLAKWDIEDGEKSKTGEVGHDFGEYADLF